MRDSTTPTLDGESAARKFLRELTPPVLLAFTAATATYMLLLDKLGFVVASYLFLAVSMALLGSRRWLLNLLVSALTLAAHLRGLSDGLLRGPAQGQVAGRSELMGEALGYFLISWLDIKLLLLTAVGTFAGIDIGATPGLSVTMAVSILISFTFKWPVNDVLALISGIFLGGVYGGSRSAILLNMPGAPAAIATALDGYPMAKRGEAGQAIGLTTGGVRDRRICGHPCVGTCRTGGVRAGTQVCPA